VACGPAASHHTQRRWRRLGYTQVSNSGPSKLSFAIVISCLVLGRKRSCQWVPWCIESPRANPSAKTGIIFLLFIFCWEGGALHREPVPGTVDKSSLGLLHRRSKNLKPHLPLQMRLHTVTVECGLVPISSGDGTTSRERLSSKYYSQSGRVVRPPTMRALPTHIRAPKSLRNRQVGFFIFQERFPRPPRLLVGRGVLVVVVHSSQGFPRCVILSMALGLA